MYYDLNVPWTPSAKDAELQRKVAFLAERMLHIGHRLLDERLT